MVRFCFRFVATFAISLATALPAAAQAVGRDSAAFAAVMPDAERFGPIAGEPPAAEAFRGDEPIGFVFYTRDVIQSVGYSGKPLNIFVGLGLDGRLTGARIVEQHEPILVIGVTPADLDAFVEQYQGLDIRETIEVVRVGDGDVDAVSGATISSTVMNDAILRAVRNVARMRAILGGAARRLRIASGEHVAFETLLEDGSLQRLDVTVGDAQAALAERDARLFPPGVPARDPESPLAELVFGLATPERIGASLLGDPDYQSFVARLAAGDQALFVAGNGTWSFKGTAWRRDGVFAAPYQVPAAYVIEPTPTLPERGGPLWHQVWDGRVADLAILTLALAVLTGILVFQEVLVRYRRVHFWLRTGFHAFTLFWLGWYASAQLSVLNVLTFAEALRTEFRWDFFLLEPLMFVLSGYVAVALLFWGRGAFCGWLCPFGALRELANRLGQRFGVPQWRIPFALHERIWMIKYVVFLGLFALSLGPTALAVQVAEVEPFKTAIVLRFDRAWPFVVYAIALIGLGLFVERAFCRYLCPLGAAFAIPAKVRLFEWLKRHRQCGAPCQICATECPVQAIHPDGRINPNECITCLNCQANYHDAFVCPPMIERRTRRERRQAILER